MPVDYFEMLHGPLKEGMIVVINVKLCALTINIKINEPNGQLSQGRCNMVGELGKCTGPRARKGPPKMADYIGPRWQQNKKTLKFFNSNV